MGLVGDFELAYGTLVWVDDDRIAACLIPAESAKPLTKIALLSLSSGSCPIVLDQAVGQSEGFEIYDVRATSSGVIWTESDILDGTWRVYTATTNGTSLGKPVKMDEGSSTDWETPTLAVSGDQAFWQVLPQLSGPKRKESSVLKRATFGSSTSDIAYSSNGRMATPPYSLDDGVVITPRANADTVNYQLTLLDSASSSVADTLVLPQSMTPLEAAYGKTGFMFSFDAIYNYGDGIANLGTYVPKTNAANSDYSSAPWFRFAKTPTAAPAWCGSYLMVKSTLAVCGIDLDSGEYFAFTVPDGADSYGEYLASSGMRGSVVTYANINYQPLSGAAQKLCRVRVWKPLS